MYGGQKAIDSIKRNRPDVIFLDVHLDGMTGFDVLDAIPTHTFEVIVTTADDGYAIRALKSRAMDYLLKPIKKEELVEAVKNLESKI